MAKYSDIKGFTVQTLSTDTVASQAAGGAWASGGALNTARGRLAGAGSATTTAGLAFGGSTPPSTYKNETEEYNGTSWSEQNNLNTARDFLDGAGIQTSAMAVTGHTTPSAREKDAENYDGTSWTAITDVNVAGAGRNAAGASNTAVVVFGGYTPGSDPASLPTGQTGSTEVWNGSSWTEVNDLNSARFSGGGSGTSTNAIMATGLTSSPGAEIANV